LGVVLAALGARMAPAFGSVAQMTLLRITAPLSAASPAPGGIAGISTAACPLAWVLNTRLPSTTTPGAALMHSAQAPTLVIVLPRMTVLRKNSAV